MANLGDINVGLGVDSGSFTSGIAKALQDLAQFAKGFKEVGIQGIEPLLKNLQAFSKATKDSFSETAKGKKIMEDLISLENTLVSLSSKVTSSEGQRTTAVDKGNRALEARQKLLQKIAEQDKLAKGQAISGGLNLLPDPTAPANIPATAWSDYGKLNEKLNRNFLTSVNESFGTGKTSVLESFSAVGKEATRFSTLLENMKNTNAFKSISKDVDLLSQEIEKAVLKAQGLTEKGNIGAARAVLTGAQGKVAAVQDTVNLQTYQQLRIATDGLAEANSKLGNSRLELQQKSENLRTSQGNLYAMAKTGKGDIAALSDEHGKLGVQLKETEKAMGKFQAAGHRTGMTIQSLIEWQMEWYLTQNILFGATGIIGQGIKNMVEFEQKMANLKAITNSTTADTELMGKAARQLGMNSRLGALEIADGMTIIGQAGFSAKETIQAMGAAVALSTSTLSDMAISTDLITTALRAFEMDASRASEAANIFAASTNYSKLTMDDLKTAFNYVAVIGKQAGLSLEEVNSTLGATRNVGIQASTAATGFRGLLGSLIAPSERFRKELEKHNIALKDINPLYNDWITVLRRLKDLDMEAAFKGLDKRIAGFTMAAIKSVDMNEQLLKSITNTDAAFEMMNIQLGTTRSNLKMIGNNFSEVGLKISGLLLPPVYALSLGFSNLLKSLNSISLGLGDTTRQFLLFASSVVILTGGFYLLVQYAIPFVAGLLGMTAAAGGFFATIGAFLTGGWGIALVAVLTGIATYFGITAYNANKTKQAMLDLNKEANLNIIILSSVRKEVEKYKDGSVELASVVDRLVSLYPELASKANIYKGSVTLLKAEIDKLTESQNNLFLASVATKLGVAEEARKGIPISRSRQSAEDALKERGIPTNAVDAAFMKANVRGSFVEPTYNEIKKKIEDLKKVQQDLFTEQGNVGEDVIKFTEVKGKIVKNQEVLTTYTRYLDSVEKTTIATLREYVRIRGGVDSFVTGELAKLGLKELPLEKTIAKAEKPKAPLTGETDKEIADRLKTERYAISRQEQFDKELASLRNEAAQREIEANRAKGKEIEVVEQEFQLKKLQIQERANDNYREIDTKMQLAIRTKGDPLYNKDLDDYKKSAKALKEANDQKAKLKAYYDEEEISAEETKNNKIIAIKDKATKEFLQIEKKYFETLDKQKKDQAAALVTYEKENKDQIHRLTDEETQLKIAALREIPVGIGGNTTLKIRGRELEAVVLEHQLRLKRINDDEEKELERAYNDATKAAEKFDEIPLPVSFAQRYLEEQDKIRVISESKRAENDRRLIQERKKAIGKDPMEGLVVGVDNVMTRFGTFGDQIQRFTETGLQNFTDGMADAFTSFVDGTKSAGDAFKDFTKTFLQEILKQINSMLAMYAVKQMVGLATTAISAYSGSYGGQGGISGGMAISGGYSGGSYAGFATGGIIPSNIKSFRSFAGGGMTSRPALAILGDNASQKELVIPSENIREDSVSGYTRDKSQGSSLVNINLIDPMMVPAIMAAYPGATLNIIGQDIMKKGSTYNAIKSVGRR